MTTPADKKDKPDKEPTDIKVTVSFPLAGKGPFKDEFNSTTPVETVRLAAMAHFEAQDDQTAVYYLTLKGDRADAGMAIGNAAGKSRAVRFMLAKELFQG